jgi:hypothetical protein
MLLVHETAPRQKKNGELEQGLSPLASSSNSSSRAGSSDFSIPSFERLAMAVEVSAESVTEGGLTFGRGMMGSGGSDVWHDCEAQ